MKLKDTTDQALIDILAKCPTSWQGDEGFANWLQEVADYASKGGTQPAPVISGTSPASVPAGSTAVSLNVFGTNFGQGAVVTIGGADKPTTASLQTDADFPTAGAVPVQVRNGDGSLSNTFDITVT